MKNLNTAKKSVLGNMIIRQTMGGSRKEDKIKDRVELRKRIYDEYKKQNSKETHKLDLTMLDVSEIDNMNAIFESYDNKLEYINVSNWNVSNVYDMGYMFYGCESLKSIDVSNWDVSNVEDMEYMFFNCKSLKQIDVSKWDIIGLKTSELDDPLRLAFYGCMVGYELI